MKQPSSVTEMRRFLGMTNQMSKFISEMVEKAKPLRDLLSKTASGHRVTSSNRHLMSSSENSALVIH